MTPERWHEVEEVLQAALARPEPERASLLDAACAGDRELRDEATSLISAFEAAGDFIEQPAIEIDARVLTADDTCNNIGRDVGAYRVVSRLGAGGMGEVYRAQDTRLDRLVALKILPAYFVSDDLRLSRFQREARATSALNHPNILTIHEVGESEDVRFIATEFIDGLTIRELITRQELSLDDVLDIAEQVLSGLSAAHAAGIVHRDIKPENIMRRADGLVKILDFGIAKLSEQAATGFVGLNQTVSSAQTEFGMVMGTVGYMSPEQTRGLPVDERTDVWSLGVVLYEMLARRLPFSAATRADTMVLILEREPPPLGEVAQGFYPGCEHLQRIIERALRKDTGERYQSAAELLSDLKNFRREPLKLSRGSVSGATGTRSRSRNLFYLCGVTLLIVALAGMFLYRRLSWRSPASTAVNQLVTAATGKLYAEMSETEQLDFINEQEQRVSNMMGDRPAQLNAEALRSIKHHVDDYVGRSSSTSTRSGEESLSVIYTRAPPFVPLIVRSFAARRVPVVVGIYLPMVESEYKVCFENSIGARGLFQFLPQTAATYGVPRRDMCDAEKMTPAAAHYIADRMAELGEDSESVTLVVLSYNRGAESVRNILRELRSMDNYERNFWTLMANREKLGTFSEREMDYIPKFFAAAIIGENPKTFGLPTPPLSTLGG
jgi:serine/threonine protein kinase